ncbi:MAG: multicopper oxidase domain-containing protein [Gemmatimonadaceae bacterium]
MTGTQMLATLITTAAVTATGGVAASIKEFRIPIRDAKVEIANGVKYQGWTFGGTVQGPVIHVRQGDLVRITVVNDAGMPHSIDFHAARIAANVACRVILPKDSISFEFVARDAGACLVHCGTPPVTMHLMRACTWRSTWSRKTAGHNRGQGIRDRVVGDRVRFYVVNAGPNFDSEFHVVGAIFDRVYPDLNPAHALEDVQTYRFRLVAAPCSKPCSAATPAGRESIRS